jgi:hypothetical protein
VSQRRFDIAQFHLLQRHWQSPCIQLAGEHFGLICSEVATNDAFPGNNAIDHRCREEFLVQEDGQALVVVGTGEALKDVFLVTTELERHFIALLIDRHPRVGQQVVA